LFLLQREKVSASEKGSVILMLPGDGAGHPGRRGGR
jgi:hypothetical protein